MRTIKYCLTVAAGLALTGCIYMGIDDAADGSRRVSYWRFPGLGEHAAESVRGDTDWVSAGQTKGGLYQFGGQSVDALASTLAIAIPVAAQFASQQAAVQQAQIAAEAARTPPQAPTPSPAPIIDPEPRAPAPPPVVTPAPGPVVLPLAGDNVFNPAANP